MKKDKGRWLYSHSFLYLLIYITMKIGKREMGVLTNAIIEKVFDSKAIEEALKNWADKAWEEYKKTKEWKNILKCFEIEGISSMYVDTSKLFGFKKWRMYSNMGTLYRGELDDGVLYKRAYRESNREKYPYECDLRKEIELQLTIEALGWNDINLILDNIISVLKRKYKI